MELSIINIRHATSENWSTAPDEIVPLKTVTKGVAFSWYFAWAVGPFRERLWHALSMALNLFDKIESAGVVLDHVH